MTDQETITTPAFSNLKISQSGNGIKYTIPAKGVKGTGLVTIIVILVWLVTILVWTGILLMMKPINALYSIPLWAIGIFTLIKSLKVLSIEQSIELTPNAVIFSIRQGAKYDERKFNKDEITMSLVEGSYYSANGLMRRGQYPAIIYNEEAFSFGERLSVKEKQWLIDSIKNNIAKY